MLPRNYRFSVYNDSGSSVDVTTTVRRWKFTSQGVVDFEGSEATLLSATGLADDTLATGTAQDNSTDAYIGASGVMQLTGSGSGVVTLFLEPSTDGGSSWPSAEKGIPIAAGIPGDDVAFTV